MRGGSKANKGGTGRIPKYLAAPNDQLFWETGPPNMFGGIPKGSETPAVDVFDDGSEGTGKYPAHHVQDGPSTGYTVYAPKTPPPADVKLPVLVTQLARARGRRTRIYSPKLRAMDSSSLPQDRQDRKCPVSQQAPCPKCPRSTCHLCQRCQRSTVIGPRPPTLAK
jgi:hypothetical protein